MNWLKENWFKIGIVLALIFVGLQINDNKDPILALEEAVSEYPRSTYGEPAQWFMMKSLVGWERMMFVFGYVDDREVCEHLVEIASEESPDREFRCEDAN